MDKGVYMGCIFVVMLVEVGVILCIVGYSECCVDNYEIDVEVKVKVEVVIVVGMMVIVCVGEIID